MTFQGPVLALLALALLPILVTVLLAILLSGFLHLRIGCLSSVALGVVAFSAAFGICAYLDSLGSAVAGEVIDKKESLVYHLDGSWNRKLVADIKYSSSDTALPVTEALDLPPASFDELHQGDFVQLRCSDSSSPFRIVRLEGEKTMSAFWSRVADQPFLFFFVLGLLLAFAARFALHLGLPMLFLLGGLVTIGSWWIASVGVPIWQQSATLMGSLNSVTANVREIHPPYLGSGLQGWIATNLFTPYDLVLLDIIPLGRSQPPILSVDEVDVGSADLRPGQTINVEYSASNPRSAVIPGASRSYLWKNGLLGTLFALLASLGVGRLAFLIRERSERVAVSAGESRPRDW
jgi:hypothetical protein